MKIVETSSSRRTSSPAKKSPVERFIAATEQDARFAHCEFESDLFAKNTVVLVWLEGGGGLVPSLTSLADNYGVTLVLMVEIHGRDDGGRLVPYYEKNGFVINGSDFKDGYNFVKMPKSISMKAVTMIRKPSG